MIVRTHSWLSFDELVDEVSPLTFSTSAMGNIRLSGNNFTPFPPTPPPAYSLAINDPGGQLVVGIRRDGQVDFGPSYNGDQAATRFWNAVNGMARGTP